MSGRWWRAYNRARHDPKLLKLSDKQFRWWFNLVCVAADNDGVLPSHADLAVEFRVSSAAMTQALDALIAAGLLDHDDTGIHPHNWNALQYKSDTSADRMRRLRERHRDVTRNKACDVTSAVTVTRSETETEADTEQTLAKAREARTPKSGTRIPTNWRPTDAGRSYAAERGLDPDSTADAFTDWWSAANGPNAVKRDWDAAFRTWCRRDAANPVRPVGPPATRPVQSSRGGDAYLDQLALIARRDDANEPDRH